ncbi:hypothetical protein [Marinitenerispora sediminis]|uniref:Uncharacterized protein n=1 Tax=Marinitenerispora sediminis TaxID=1931232 RepID=A0A368SYR7_9ACTN|nr:hypothetical protein [Marinitenerispora sediminis]RCV47715.1 hypothetical protein DEF28_25505 [Marinitenerispora sediminis]RCV48185.1 hypothetical protein DEF23_25420 [Marinitenerispora sediminis]RCV49673.1 hypothetical protein DEF24_24970 [Marinitenerispora sediminis]
MIGRLFSFVAGAALGGYVVHKLNRTARAWSPGGIADRVEGHVADYRAALREFNEDVQDAMEQREAELRHRYYPSGPAVRAAQPKPLPAPHTKPTTLKDGR